MFILFLFDLVLIRFSNFYFGCSFSSLYHSLMLKQHMICVLIPAEEHFTTVLHITNIFTFLMFIFMSFHQTFSWKFFSTL